MRALDMVGLTPLMERTRGRPEMTIGLVDGPVAMDHPGLESARLREIPAGPGGRCTRADSIACGHGTFVAGILVGKRGSPAPAICPECTVLVRPIFSEATPPGEPLPLAAPGQLAAAIGDCIAAGARVINMSLALVQPSARGEPDLDEALGEALRRGVLVVAAAGNQGAVGGSPITRHPWVIPVAACDLRGRPVGESNLGRSIGRRGLSAPGEGITSLGAAGAAVTSGGTSVAAAFVTGAIALLGSEFAAASAAQVKYIATQAVAPRRSTVVPPLLDAWAAYHALARALG